MDQSSEEYLTVAEVAIRLKLDRTTVYRMANQGRIPAIKFGKVWRISSLKLAGMFNEKQKE
jgi:excisionase family DNA binding protein